MLRLPTAVWLKAPVLFLRFPALGSAVATAALVLALATASAPLFVAASGNAAIELALAGVTSEAAGLEVTTNGVMDAETFAAADEALRAAVNRTGRLAGPRLFALSSGFTASAGGSETRARMLSRDGFADHIEILQEDPAVDGVWITDSIAETLELGPGDELSLTFGEDSAATRVRGVYADLRDVSSLPHYWATLSPLFVARDTQGIEPPPPPIIMADTDSFLDAGRVLPPSLFRWQAPLRTEGLTRESPPLVGGDSPDLGGGAPQERHEVLTLGLDDAQRLAADLQRLTTDVTDGTTELGAVMNELSAYGAPRTLTSFAAVVDSARQAQAALAGPVGLLSLAARAVALLVVAAAAVFAVQRRRSEHQLFVAAGELPAATGLRSSLEAAVPLAVGAAAGVQLAVWLVGWLGPAPIGDPAVRARAVNDVVVSVALALLVYALTTPVAVGRQHAVAARPGGRTLERLAWEPVALALAAATLYQLSRRNDAGEAFAVDLLVLAFPLLVIAAGSGLCGRLLRRSLPRLRRVGGGWRPSMYLAARQVAGASRPALLLVVASSIAIGVGVYAAVLAVTSARTVDAKAHVLVGSDVRVEEPTAAAMAATSRFPTTLVRRLETTFTGRNEVDVLAVDPVTFADAVSWDGRFAERPLDELLVALQRDAGGRLPVLIVGGGVPDRTALEESHYAVPVQVVGRPRAFPGASARRPLLVVDADGYVTQANASADSSIDVGLLFEPELWVRGDGGEIMSALRAAGLRPEPAAASPFAAAGPVLPAVAGADAVASGPGLASIGWTFGYLQAVGLASALLGAVGLLLYLQARQAEREVTYVLSRRMGLSRGAHRLAVALELAAMLTVALATGTLLALLAAWLVNARLDPLPQVPPAPLLTVPRQVLLGVLGCLPLLAVVGALLVQRAADRTRVAEVLRLAR